MINRIELILKEGELFCNFFFIRKAIFEISPNINLWINGNDSSWEKYNRMLQTVILIRVTRFRTIIHRICIESLTLKFWTNNRFKESYTPLSIYHLFLPVYSKKKREKNNDQRPRAISLPINPETFNPFFPIHDTRLYKAQTSARSLERISVTQISRSVSNWKGRQVPQVRVEK